MIYDIVVIGGGPAGSVFSKFINNKYKVLLLDRRDYEDENNKIIKCCGGLLAHDIHKRGSSYPALHHETQCPAPLP